MWITERAFRQAKRRGSQRRCHGPVVASARFHRSRRRIVVLLQSGLELAFRPRDVPGLEAAPPEKLVGVEVSPSGLGLHFPALDADVYLPALIESFLGTRSWTASESGGKGGRSTTEAKAQAARSNGRLGGRRRS